MTAATVEWALSQAGVVKSCLTGDPTLQRAPVKDSSSLNKEVMSLFTDFDSDD